MTQLDSKDLFRNLHANCAIDFFFFCPHLIFHVCIQIFDVMFFIKNILESKQGSDEQDLTDLTSGL